ncbi:MAG: hypothetical protein ACXIVQ_06535 [Acidimicrobiales bacterium]
MATLVLGGSTAASARTPADPEPKDQESTAGPAPQAAPPADSFAPASTAGSGYWMIDLTGNVYPFGAAGYHGQPSSQHPHYPDCSPQNGLDYCDIIIDIEGAPGGGGYWALDTTGWIWRYGSAANLGSFGTWRDDPWMSITATTSGNGMWGFSYQGCVETLGSAPFHGDMCGVRLNAPVIGSAVTPSGNGYYMVAADGGIFSFGDARFYGSTGSMRLNQPVTDMVVSPTGNGYWLVALDGGVFAFGDARFYGSMGSVRLNKPISGMVASPTGGGYLMVAEDGGIFSFGDVPFHGSLGSNPPRYPVVAVAVR